MKKHSGKKSINNLNRYGNRTVLNTVAILQAVAALNAEATLASIAKKTGMLESRAQRYLISLVASGLLDHHSNDGGYTLGSGLIDLGLTALGRMDAVRVASDTLYQLTQETGIVSLLSVWGSNGATVIKCEQGNPVSSSHIREGRNLSLLQTATGQVFLAYLPASDTSDFLARELLSLKKAAPSAKNISPEEIERLKAKVRKAGLARSTGRMGNDAVAAPVFNHEGKLEMVLALFARGQTADLNPAHRPATRLREAAAALSKRFGAQIKDAGEEDLGASMRQSRHHQVTPRKQRRQPAMTNQTSRLAR